MKRYEFKLIIEEGSDEFWESLRGKTGCDEVTEAIKESLENHGWVINDGDGNELFLVKYTNFDQSGK